MSDTINLPPNLFEKSRRVALWTKFWAAMTAFMLASATTVSLISVLRERDGIQHQLRDQSTEIYCRNAASVATTKAIAIEENLIAEALVYVASGDIPALKTIVVFLKEAIQNVDEAIKAEELAQKDCIEK